MQKISKAVIPVAGLGTRFLPVTKAIPKELLPIVDTPVLQLLVEEATTAGIEEIIFVVNPEKTAIREYFSPNEKLEETLKATNKTELLARLRKIQELAKFKFVEQAKALGDGHAVLQAQDLVGDEPFLVLFGDDLILAKKSATEQLLETWQEKQSAVVALMEVEQNEVSNYGVVEEKSRVEDLVGIKSFVEKPAPERAPSNLAIVGKYVCPPQIFEILQNNPNASGEIRLIDALSRLVQTEPVFGKICQGERYDIGNKFGFVKANLDFALQHPEIAEETKNYLKKIKL